MVQRQIARRGIRDQRVLAALRAVPREAFISPELAEFAYDDTPLPIEAGQTISQPYIVALMIEALRPAETDRVLEIGAGSGYAAAVMSRAVAEVYAVERQEELAASAGRSTPRIRASRWRPVARASRARCSISWPSAAGWSCRSARRACSSSSG